MDLVARARIPFPRELVFGTIRDRLPELVPHMPNVKSIEVKERHEEGAVTRLLNLWTAKAEIPAIAQRYMKAEMLQWTDSATWDAARFVCDWSIEMLAFPGVLECSARNTYHAVGDETELEINGSLVLHLDRAPIPRMIAFTVRPLIERIVGTSLRPNLTSIGDGVAGYLRAQAASATT
jgi:hypothetical protein